MTYRSVRPSPFHPEDLDRYLAHGWYRMRQTMFTCTYLLGPRGVHTPVWTRLPLTGHLVSRNQRRRIRRIERHVSVDVAPFEQTPEHESLYRIYREHVGGSRSDELSGVLRASRNEEELFDTWEVSFRHRGDLVGYSLFDRGSISLQSILGVYDPSKAKWGLGIGSMLYEVRYGIEHGFDYHYAGYVVPGLPTFDYKTQVGPLQAYDPVEDTWNPLDTVEPSALPAQQLQTRLLDLKDRLREAGVQSSLRTYPPFQVVVVDARPEQCLTQPLYLHLGPSDGRTLISSVTYDPLSRLYRLDRFAQGQDLREVLFQLEVPRSDTPTQWRLLLRAKPLAASTQPETILRAVREHLETTPG